MSATYYNVAPRYSPGSPAQVDSKIACEVASDERRFYPRVLEGIYGEEQAQRARDLGLSGIVEMRSEKADCWIVTDLITQRTFVRMFPTRSAREDEPRHRIARAHRLASKYHLPVEGM